jgi:hypothetical protein
MTDLQLEELYEELAGIVAMRDTVPRPVVAAAKASFAWRTIDDELAALVYDSADEAEMMAGVRGGSARQLTFSSSSVTIELEVGATSRGVVGQLVPPQSAALEVRHSDGSVYLSTDDLGRFDIERVPDGPVSIRCTPASGRRFATDWVRF